MVEPVRGQLDSRAAAAIFRMLRIDILDGGGSKVCPLNAENAGDAQSTQRKAEQIEAWSAARVSAPES
jgi:hypothetical protein